MAETSGFVATDGNGPNPAILVQDPVKLREERQQRIDELDVKIQLSVLEIVDSILEVVKKWVVAIPGPEDTIEEVKKRVLAKVSPT
jgi:hypothetical protein